MSHFGPQRQAAFFGPTVANGALRTWLDLRLAPVAIEPTAALALQCGNALDAGFNPYQSTRMSR